MYLDFYNFNLFPALRNGWKIISPSKSFVVYAATATEKSQWMSHIRKCVNDLLLKSKSLPQAFTCTSNKVHDKYMNSETYLN